MSGVALSAVILSIAMGLAGANLWLLIPMVFFFVGASSAFYTIGLAMIGERVRPGALASANAAFIFAYGLGSLLGPALGGVSMDLADPWGLMAAFAAMAGLYFVLSILSNRVLGIDSSAGASMFRGSLRRTCVWRAKFLCTGARLWPSRLPSKSA